MIKQRINLYQERFKDKMLWLSAAQLVSLVLCVLVGIVAWSFMIDQELKESKQNNLTLKASQKSVTDELVTANSELAKLLDDDSMDHHIAGVSREISARKRVIKFVDNNQFGSGQGFSSYLVALSNLRVDNLWLDEISLAENYVKIRGSALNAELVPTYFDRFSEQEAFQGQRFHVFQLDRSEETDWKVDFEIATEASGDE